MTVDLLYAGTALAYGDISLTFGKEGVYVPPIPVLVPPTYTAGESGRGFVAYLYPAMPANALAIRYAATIYVVGGVASADPDAYYPPVEVVYGGLGLAYNGAELTFGTTAPPAGLSAFTVTLYPPTPPAVFAPVFVATLYPPTRAAVNPPRYVATIYPVRSAFRYAPIVPVSRSHGETLYPATSTGESLVPRTGTGPLFYVVEVESYRPASGTTGAAAIQPWGALPWGALSVVPVAVEATDTLLASDVGYRTTPAEGVAVYPPYLDTAFSIDRKLNLDPTQPAAAAAWGTVTLTNPAGCYDSLIGANNSDGRSVQIFVGRKGYDPARGYFTDPAKAALRALFTGVAQNWFLSDTDLTVPIRDATYFLERPVQSATYGGTGGLDGGADVAGTLLPRARGYVRNVAPVLIDALNRIYQWSDGPVQQVTALWEGGTRNILPQNATTTSTGAPNNDVADLYSGGVASGYYRTCNAKGLFQLGVGAARQITLDGLGGVTANMSVKAANSPMADLAVGLILDDLAIDARYIDVASFRALPTYAGGYYLSGQATDGATLLGQIAASVGAKVFPRRDGRLSALLLRALPATAVAVVTFDTSVAMTVAPVPLGANLDPPPWRYRVGYARAFTVQTTDLNPNISDAQRQFVAQSDRYAVQQSGPILAAYRRPTDPPQLPTFLAAVADATKVAAALVALWSIRRRVYNVVLPVDVGLAREIGDVVRLVWPMDDLAGGRLGQIIGEQFRGGDAQITFQVLV